MFVIKANTPESMRNEIVKWLNQQASNHRIAAAKMSGIHKKEVEQARATTYEGAAKFLEGCMVESIDILKLIEDMRISEAGLFDDAHSGQRGEDRSTALYDAYQMLHKAFNKS